MSRFVSLLTSYRLELLPEPEPIPADPVLPWFFWFFLLGVLLLLAAIIVTVLLLIRHKKRKKQNRLARETENKEDPTAAPDVLPDTEDKMSVGEETEPATVSNESACSQEEEKT